jgi:predicted dienelactone hydrolase
LDFASQSICVYAGLDVAGWTRRILRTLKILILSGVALVAILIAGLWIEQSSQTSLPEPTGPFAVGRAYYDWVDQTALDRLAPATGIKRELLVWIWYPADPNSGPIDEYMPADLRPPDEGGTNIWTFLTRDVSRVRGHSHRNATVAAAARPFPMVVLRGGGSSGVLNYSSLAEDLTSHGYVVVGFDAPYRTGLVVFPDGRAIGRTNENNPEGCLGLAANVRERCAARLIDAWNSDTAFVLDRLAQLNGSAERGLFSGRLDTSRVGLFGHSFGGATIAEFCRQDARCRAGVNIDGEPHGRVIETGLRQPFMFLLSDHRRDADPESRQIKADIRSIYDRLPADGRLALEIHGAFHFMFSDDGAVRKSGLVRGVVRLLGRLQIDARRQLAITSYCLRAFFDAHLKPFDGPPPAIPSPEYPELQPIK